VSQPDSLAEILVSRGLVTPQLVEEAVARQRASGERFGEMLVSMGAITQEQLSWALSEALHIPFVDLSDEVVDLEVARSLPEEVLRRHEAVPILRVGDEMTVLLADPTDRQAAIELEALSGARVTVALAARDAVRRFLDKAFPQRSRAPGTGARVEVAGDAPLQTEDLTGVSQVFSMLLDAVRGRASELHVEPRPEAVLVRARIDGRLVERTRFPRELLAPITFRLRLLAGLRSEPAPRAARVRTRLDGRDVSLDLLFFPTLSGEAVTVSLRPALPEAPNLDDLGVSEATRAVLAGLLEGPGGAGDPGGLVIVSGDDVQTRAEVLYALARAASDPGARTLTVERSPAFVVSGFLQVELADRYLAGSVAVLGQPADVVLLEDVLPPVVCAAALSMAERGALVLAGVGLVSARSALAYLASSDLRGPMLGLTRGVVEVHRRPDGRVVNAQALTPATRRDLLDRRDPWTSPTC
jgi:type IV pilus assembly protein PilB